MTGLDQRCADLAAEVGELRALLSDGDVSPERLTPFHGWRVRDSIQHMVTIDRLATLALGDRAAFQSELEAFLAGSAPPDGGASREESFGRIALYERRRLGLLGWNALLAAWGAGLADLTAAVARRAPDDKVPWFGGSMRVESLLSARHMEVWAYGQDVFDSCRARRIEGDRIRTVVEFGLKTFGFSFANRGETIPLKKPYVALSAPEGSIWTWNDEDAPDRIEGRAVDFCMVVTQRRHVEDTALRVEGVDAARWMRIAQCIAGAPVDGPRKEERAW